MAAFPGDPEVALHSVRSVARGDPYNLSHLEMGTHAGTHLDPPCHFVPGAPSIDEIDLAILSGPCRVWGVDEAVRSIGATELSGLPAGTARLLFKTRNSSRWAASDGFFSDYVALSPDAAPVLIERGVRLVGIDSLSVERDTTGTFPGHHALLSRGILILEGIRLSGVDPGPHELRCLPLRLAKGDGGPARAVLIEP